MSRRSKALVLVVTVGLVFTACSNSNGSGKAKVPSKSGTSTELFPVDALNKPRHEGTPTRGGSIKFGLEAAVLNISPAQSVIQPPDLQVVLSVFDPLVKYDDAGEPTGNIAESFESSDDFKTWTIHLRDDVQFSNGVPLDAQQVVDHTKWLQASSACTCATDAANIASIAAPDAHTVVYQLTEGNVAWPTKLAANLGWISETGARNASSDPANPDLAHLVGAGPFQFASHTGDTYVVERNPHYFGTDPLNDDAPLPYVDQITFVPLADAGTRLAAVQSGGVDIMQTAVTSTLAQAVKDPDLRVQPASGSSATIFILNLSRPPFGVDPKPGESPDQTVQRALADPIASDARRAFVLAVNRNEINQKYYQGTRVPAYSPIPPSSPYFDPDGQLPRYDPDAARKLVAKVKAAGVDFTVRSICIPTPEASGVFNVLGPQLEAVGIRAERKGVDQAVLVQTLILGKESTATANWNMSCFRSAQLADPDGLFNGLHSSGTGNSNHYTNTVVDEALEKGRQVAGVAARKPFYDTVQQEKARDIPTMELLYDLSGNVYQKRLSGLNAPSPAALALISPAGLYLQK